MRGITSFLLGSAIGLAAASAIYYVFTFAVSFAYSNLVISGITLPGIGLAVGGYYMHWKGDNSPGSYFILGLGVGIVIVAFIGAGNGTSPAIGTLALLA